MKSSQFQTRSKSSRWKKKRGENFANTTSGQASPQERMFQEIVGEKPARGQKERFFPRSEAHKGRFRGERKNPVNTVSNEPLDRPQPPVVLVGGERPEMIQAMMEKLFALGFPTCGASKDFLSSGFASAIGQNGQRVFGGCAIAVPHDHPVENSYGSFIALWVGDGGKVRTDNLAGRSFDWLQRTSQGRVLRVPPSSLKAWSDEQVRSLSRFLNHQLPEA